MQPEPPSTPAGWRLLRAAAGLFYLHGINAVGVAWIAAEAGVTKKTLYDCFGSKDGIVSAYLWQRHLDWQQILEELLAQGGPTPLAVFDSYLVHLESGTRVNGCGFVNAAADLPGDHPAMVIIRAHKAQVRRRIDDLLSTAAKPSPTLGRTGAHLFYLLEGATAEAGLLADLAPIRAAREIAASLVGPDAGGGH